MHHFPFIKNGVQLIFIISEATPEGLTLTMNRIADYITPGKNTPFAAILFSIQLTPHPKHTSRSVDGHGITCLAKEDDEAVFRKVDDVIGTCVVCGVNDLEKLVVDIDC